MNFFKEKIIKQKLPNHIAIIMDGNGRWAKKNGLLRIKGHKNGVNTVRKVVEVCIEIELNFLTLYAFSNENWKRPKTEVKELMKILVKSLRKELPNFKKNNIKFSVIGELENLGSKINETLSFVISETKNHTGLNLILALSYSSKNEIVNAIKCIGKKLIQNKIDIKNINENLVSENLYTANIPNPDLLIRTSGEFRISNFLLWQIAYTEFYFSEKLWPDFDKIDFYEALYHYQKRERRYGKTTDQLNKQ